MGTSDVHIAMERVVARLHELGIPYAICGAMAVCVHGLKRATDGVNVLRRSRGLAQFKARLIRANVLGEHCADGLHSYVREKYRELWRIAQMPPATES